MKYGLLCLALAGVPALAAEHRVSVPAGGEADFSILLSAQDLRSSPVLCVRADPNQVEVTVTGPDGVRWTAATQRAQSPVEIHLADRDSGSQDEASTARILGGNATLVQWNARAVAGIYRVRLFGIKLTASAEVVAEQSTMAEFQKALESSAERRLKQEWASMMAAPERRVPLDGQGRATATLEGAPWDSEDVVMAGTTLGKRFAASLRMPDGTVITESTAQQAGCTWEWHGSRKIDLEDFLETGPPHLRVSCPRHMGPGAISISIDAGPQNQHAQMGAGVLRAKALSAYFERLSRELVDSAEAPRTVQLVAVPEGTESNPMSVSAAVNRPKAIRVRLMEGAKPTSSVQVQAQVFQIDEKKAPRVRVIGPHPSKIPVGPPAQAAGEPGGTFVYSFLSHRMGTYHVDLTAEGQFADGRRFTADLPVSVFVQPFGGTVTRVRQQRIDLTNNPNAGRARFLLDIDVVEPGLFDATIQVGDHPPARGQQELEAGKQTMMVECNREFLALLEKNPQAQLSLTIISQSRKPETKSYSIVEIAATLPKAGAFETLGALRNDTRSSGAAWRLVDTNGDSKPDHLSVSLPVVAEGTGCEWVAWLEINPKEPAGVNRTVGYQQRGTFVPKAGRARVETLWDLAPFALQSNRQAFEFQVLKLRCGAKYAWVAPATPDDTVDNRFVLRFTADLSGVEPLRTTARARASAGAPAIAGLTTVTPLDKDQDGKFDHVKLEFDLISPGGTCIWSAWLFRKKDSGGAGPGGSAVTKPGLNHVSMELDAWSSLSLSGDRLFRVAVGRIKCGADPEFSERDIEKWMEDGVNTSEQEFAIRPGQFVEPGKYKVPPPPPLPAQKPPKVLVQPYHPAGMLPVGPGIPQPTDRHGTRFVVKVTDGTESIRSIEQVTARISAVDIRALRKLPPPGSPAAKAARTPVGPPLIMKGSGNGMFECAFFHRVPGFYEVEFQASGTLKSGQTFTEAGAQPIFISKEDLALISLDQQAVDLDGDGKPDEARARMVIDSVADQKVGFSASLWRQDLTEQLESAETPLLDWVQLRKGQQTVVVKLPREALAQSGKNVFLNIWMQPEDPRLPDGKTREIQCYCDSQLGWCSARGGYFPLALKPAGSAR